MSGMTMRAVSDGNGGWRHVPVPLTLVQGGKEAKGKGKKPVVPDPFKTDGNVAAEELRLLIERVERLDEEIRGMQDDRKDVLAEAKGRGFNTKAILKIIAARRQKKEEWQELEGDVETYMVSLGML